MTKVEVEYELTRSLEDELLGQIAQAPKLFGLTRVRLAPSMDKLIVEYDASRLTPAQVDAALHSAGLPAKRID
jgi:hypothetical protein